MATKKVICTSVKFAFAFEVSSVSLSDITLKSGYTLHTIKAITASLSQEMEIGDPGPYYQQTLAVTTNDADPGHDMLEQDMIFKLTTESGSTLILGSLTEPLRFTQGPKELEGYKASFKRSTTEGLL